MWGQEEITETAPAVCNICEATYTQLLKRREYIKGWIV